MTRIGDRDQEPWFGFWRIPLRLFGDSLWLCQRSQCLGSPSTHRMFSTASLPTAPWLSGDCRSAAVQPTPCHSPYNTVIQDRFSGSKLDFRPHCRHFACIIAAHGCEEFHVRQLALVIANHVTNEFIYVSVYTSVDWYLPICQSTRWAINLISNGLASYPFSMYCY